jgi:hypothetical protein
MTRKFIYVRSDRFYCNKLCFFYDLVEPNNHLLIVDENSPNLLPSDNELVIREDGDIIESERPSYSSKVHVTPAASLNVKTFVSTSSTVPDENKNFLNGKLSDEYNEDFERNFLRAVDRALGVNNIDQNHLLQPVYDTPMKIDDSDMNLVQITERALSSFKNTNFFMVKIKIYDKKRILIENFSF